MQGHDYHKCHPSANFLSIQHFSVNEFHSVGRFFFYGYAIFFLSSRLEILPSLMPRMSGEFYKWTDNGGWKKKCATKGVDTLLQRLPATGEIQLALPNLKLNLVYLNFFLKSASFECIRGLKVIYVPNPGPQLPFQQ